MPRPPGLRIEGARQNNLKNVSLEIPHDRLTVVTGVSGSGKSSLAFDTLFAEGQWRYIESLSTYARMFLDRVDRPDVDRIENMRPAVALEQKNPVRTARSTVGTATEVYDYLRLLYAKIGRVHCPACGAAAASHSPESIADALLAEHAGARALVTFPLPVPAGQPPAELWAGLTRRGFARVAGRRRAVRPGGAAAGARGRARSRWCSIASCSTPRIARAPGGIAGERAARGRRAGRGRAGRRRAPRLRRGVSLQRVRHRAGAAAAAAVLVQPSARRLRRVQGLRQHPQVRRGAAWCPTARCSLAGGAVEPWTHPSGKWYQRELLKAAKRARPRSDDGRGTSSTRRSAPFVYEGDGKFPGINGFFEEIESYRYKLHVRVFLSRYRSQSRCPVCQGARLKPPALAVRVAGLTIAEFTAPHHRARPPRCVADLKLTAWEAAVAREILRQLRAKLTFLLRVGLGYLTLWRARRARCRAARPSASTWPTSSAPSSSARSTCSTSRRSACTRATPCGWPTSAASWPRPATRSSSSSTTAASSRRPITWSSWGRARASAAARSSFAGPQAEFRQRRPLADRALRRRPRDAFRCRSCGGRAGATSTLTGAREHNLKDVTLRVPLGTLTVVTGVSGSGKSTLVHDTLYRAVARAFKTEFQPPGAYDALTGLEYLKGVRLIDQEPIGRTPRSNPVTYVKAFDEIRKLYAALPAGQGARAQRRRVLVQRAGRALRVVPGRRLPEARDVLLRGCVRLLPGVRGPPLPPRGARREATAAARSATCCR